VSLRKRNRAAHVGPWHIAAALLLEVGLPDQTRSRAKEIGQ